MPQKGIQVNGMVWLAALIRSRAVPGSLHRVGGFVERDQFDRDTEADDSKNEDRRKQLPPSSRAQDQSYLHDGSVPH